MAPAVSTQKQEEVFSSKGNNCRGKRTVIETKNEETVFTAWKRSIVKSILPINMCFLLPSGLERVQTDIQFRSVSNKPCPFNNPTCLLFIYHWPETRTLTAAFSASSSHNANTLCNLWQQYLLLPLREAILPRPTSNCWSVISLGPLSQCDPGPEPTLG